MTGSGFGSRTFRCDELKGVPGTWQVFAVTGWTIGSGAIRSRLLRRRSGATIGAAPAGAAVPGRP